MTRNTIFKEQTRVLKENVQKKASIRSYVENKKLYFILKRLSDIVISFVVTSIVLIVLFPIFAVLIKLESRGPVFFIQRRVGRGGRIFFCYKFRTMYVNAEANTCQADEDDVRITPTGRFLRKCNLDELPQFINVLFGDMSIVGPRPHMLSDCSKFSNAIPGYKFRNIVKPGITGLAQMKGYRGPTHDFTSMFRRFQFDAFYIRNTNFLLDYRIIRDTAVQTLTLIYKRISLKLPKIVARQRRWVTAFLAVFI